MRCSTGGTFLPRLMRGTANAMVVLHRHLGAVEGLFHKSTAKKLALHTHVPLLVLQQ